jgi:hypothetical protein
MRLCLKREKGWLGVGCCWGSWVMSDYLKVSKGPVFAVVALTGVGRMPAAGDYWHGEAGVLCIVNL